MRRARTFGENVVDALSMVPNPFLLMRGQVTGPTRSNLEVAKGDFDVKEDELLDEDRADDEEVDDSPEQLRRVRVLERTDAHTETPKESPMLRIAEELSKTGVNSLQLVNVRGSYKPSSTNWNRPQIPDILSI